VKVLAVPADAAGEGATGGTTGVVGTKITLDGPVVGDIEGAPMGIVILNGSHLYRIAQHELPITVKTNSLSGM
jgi:hypothetical protein